MGVLRKVLLGVVVLALLYGGLLAVQGLMVQELKRFERPGTSEAVRLMWRPRLLKGDGVCSLDLVDAQGKVLDTAVLGTLDTGFNALQGYGQVDFDGDAVTVRNLQTGAVVRRLTLRDGRFAAEE